MNYKIIDNALSKADFDFIKQNVEKNLQWAYNQTIVDPNIEEKFPHVGFTHTFYTLNDFGIPIFSKNFDVLHPLVSFIQKNFNYICLIRAKANMYINQNEFVEHTQHTDYASPVKTALFYVNTNNGVTILNDEIVVESKENRIVIFDAQIPHRGTNCTDVHRRLNINLNFI